MTAQWPDQLPHPLIQRMHNWDSRSTVTIMETQRPRVRREFDEPLEIIEYNWHFTGDQFDVFRNYVEVNLKSGENSFTLGGFEGGVLRMFTVAFLNALQPYTFNRQDNLFAVSSVVIVVEEESAS